MRFLIVTLCLAASAIAISVPSQPQVRAKLLVPQGFRPAQAEDRTEESAELVETAATQARRPAYGEENYPIQNQNTIPVVQVRPQVRVHAQGLRRVPALQQQHQHQQQFRPAQENTQQQMQIARPVIRIPATFLAARRPQPSPPSTPASQEVNQPAASQVEVEKIDKERLEELEEEEKEEEPDRLSILLPQSKFDCVGKSTGYYADEHLGCEVFHYCQDNAKHSWICPNGFTFHQVHLICMPPGADNICEKSSQFHFVNEYLYKPLNLEEHQNKPNVSLRYSERYYPNQYYQSNEETVEYEDEEVQARKAPVQVRVQPVQQQPQPQVQQTRRLAIPAPYTAINGQIFRSAEEVNIPLQQRRPQPQFRYSREEPKE